MWLRLTVFVLIFYPSLAFAGDFQLLTRNGQVTLNADQAMLWDILLQLQHNYPGISPESVPNRPITWQCEAVPVEDFLAKLGVNFMGIYEPGGGPVNVVSLGSRLESIMDEVDIDPELKATILEYLEEFKDDGVRFNAMNALRGLAELGAVVAPFMEKALDVEDYQTRQFAAEVLTRMGTNITRSAKLDAVIIEGMADDEYPSGKDSGGNYRYTYVHNAHRAMSYFGKDKEAVQRAEPMLRASLNSDDGQQRLLAAWALGLQGQTQHALPVARILIDHLADNDLSGDIELAVNALYGLGESVRPLLEPYLDSQDAQQARVVAEILEFLGSDSVTPRYRRIGMSGWEPENFPPKP